MRCRLHEPLAALTCALSLSGCVQMTRHSNMMIFGTNTVVGIKVGANATSVPEIAIGFARQEAVILPLVANTSSVDAGNRQLNRLAPCDFGTSKGPVTLQQGQYSLSPCSLVGLNAGGLDSYSVLASFGGNFSGSSDGKASSAKAGVAQYFATGLAAQTLALNGGAAVVATGEAAEKAAEKPPVTLTGLSPTAAVFAKVAPIVKAYSVVRDLLAAKIRASGEDDLKNRIAGFEANIAGANQKLIDSHRCSSPDNCADLITENGYISNYRADPVKFENAVRAMP
jgi:hypothetical protein